MAEDDESPKKMQYLTSRSVVLTYFTEETGQVVDDHFSRALGASVSVDNDMSSVTGTNSTGKALIGSDLKGTNDRARAHTHMPHTGFILCLL